MMPLHSLLLIRDEALCSSHSDLHGAARADRQPANWNALVALLPVRHEAQDTIDSFVITKAVREELRDADDVQGVAHNSPDLQCGHHTTTAAVGKENFRSSYDYRHCIAGGLANSRSYAGARADT